MVNRGTENILVGNEFPFRLGFIYILIFILYLDMLINEFLNYNFLFLDPNICQR